MSYNDRYFIRSLLGNKARNEFMRRSLDLDLWPVSDR